MKGNKKFIFSIVLSLIVLLGFGCRGDENLIPEKNIDDFLNEKSDLYIKKEEIVSVFENADTLEIEESDKGAIESEEGLNKLLKEVKALLTEKEYERLIANRYLVDADLLGEKYDRSEIKDVKYEKLSESEEKIVYKVKYTENLYFENELKEEKNRTNEFTLEKIDNKWFISHIDEIDKITIYEREIQQLKEKNNECEIRNKSLEEEASYYKEFIEEAIKNLDDDEVSKLAEKQWTYKIELAGKTIVDDKEIEIDKRDFEIVFSEEQSLISSTINELFEKGVIDGEYQDHLKIIGIEPMDIGSTDGTLVTGFIYKFKDVPKNTNFKLELSKELRERLGLSNSIININVK